VFGTSATDELGFAGVCDPNDLRSTLDQRFAGGVAACPANRLSRYEAALWRQLVVGRMDPFRITGSQPQVQGFPFSRFALPSFLRNEANLAALSMLLISDTCCQIVTAKRAKWAKLHNAPKLFE